MPFHLLQRKRAPVTEEAAVPITAAKLLRIVQPVTPSDVLGKALHQLRTQQVPAVPVVNAGYLAGWITEERVLALLAEHPGAIDALAVGDALEAVPVAIAPTVTVEQLLPVVQQSGQALLPVATPGGLYLGCVLRADVLAAAAGRLAPPRIGGMATPLGVYLTTGTVSGGAGHLGLVLTGVVLSVMLYFAQSALILGTAWLYHAMRYPFFRMLSVSLATETADSPWMFLLTMFLLLGAFLALLRLLPRMAGFHAAEHQTVNAIEAGEPLTVEAVGRMSRVHPRCGTNLWGILVLSYVGMAILSTVITSNFGRGNMGVITSTALLVVLVIALSWRRFGSWLQQYLTTRPPTQRELESGIRAGEEIIRRHLADTQPPATMGQRLLAMGLLQVATGVLLMGFVLQLFDVPLDYLWQNLIK